MVPCCGSTASNGTPAAPFIYSDFGQSRHSVVKFTRADSTLMPPASGITAIRGRKVQGADAKQCAISTHEGNPRGRSADINANRCGRHAVAVPGAAELAGGRDAVALAKHVVETSGFATV